MCDNDVILRKRNILNRIVMGMICIIGDRKIVKLIRRWIIMLVSCCFFILIRCGCFLGVWFVFIIVKVWKLDRV